MSKIIPYPLRIVKRAKAAIKSPAKRPVQKNTVKCILKKGARGDGFPLTIAVTLCILLIFCVISEYFRVSIIAQGVRDAVQQSVIATINDNYDDVYHSVREGYAAGWFPTDDAWEESIDTGGIYENLAMTLGLTSNGSGYMKVIGGEVEYTLSGLSVDISNNALASGQSDGFLADTTIVLEVPTGFVGAVLPPVRITLKTQAKYIPVF